MRKRHIAIGFSIIAVGLILLITPVSPPHREWDTITVDMGPIYRWLVGIPLILVGIPIATAGFVKRIGKMTLVITNVLLISVWFLFILSRGS